MRESRACIDFLSLWLIASAILWRPPVGTFAQALHDEESTHILLILPIAAVLIFSEWSSEYFTWS
jgi:hypothetical protein